VVVSRQSDATSTCGRPVPELISKNPGIERNVSPSILWIHPQIAFFRRFPGRETGHPPKVARELSEENLAAQTRSPLCDRNGLQIKIATRINGLY